MNKYLRGFIATLVLVLGAQAAYGNHIFGADFYYEYLSGNTYKISLAIYGDCNGAQDPSSPYNGLPLAVPTVSLFLSNSTNPLQTVNLNLEGPGVEVTPVCPREQLNTKCNGGTIDGVKRFIYSATMNVTLTSSLLKFRFEGQLTNSQAGRSNQITNLAAQGNSIMVLEAELNNVPGPNSSPRFTTIPTPFYCVNVPQQYNQGAVDANNDSLGYLLSAPLEPTGTAAYVAGFSPTNPISYVPNTFTFSQLTGQLNFTPNISQKSLVVNKVNEYRNGVKVGSASRELTFVVLANCSVNTPPTGVPDTTSGRGVGGVMVANNTFIVCEGTGLIKFNINPQDADQDTLEVSLSGLPSGASATINNNNTTAPTVNFSWNAATAAPGNYNFFVTYKDQGCPVSASQTQAYTISIIRPNTLSSQVVFPTECAHKAKILYTLANGLLPRNVIVRQGANVLHSFSDNTGQYLDSLAAGSYTLTITSPNLTCPTTVNILVKDSGIYPYPPLSPDAFFCLNDPPIVLSATPDSTGNVFWFDSLGTRLPGPPLPNTTAAGIFRYGASQKVKVCESRIDTVLVYVTKRPIADFVIDPSPICARDTATISFTGAVGVGPILEYKYNWGQGLNPVSGSGAGPYKFTWYNPGTYTIRLQVFENRCPSDSIQRQVRVKPKPTASFVLPKSICQYDSLTVRYNNPDSLNGEQYAWDFDGATIPQSTDRGPFTLHWNTAGVKTVKLGVSLEGCTDTASKMTTLNIAPVAGILTVPGNVCLGDRIDLQYADAGARAQYTWLPKEELRIDKNGIPYVEVTRPFTYRLAVQNEFGCVDTSSISYTTVEPCCQFIYPNAFTPNNDTKNDKYHIALYGNHEYYELSIYNRWGQRVFHSADPAEGWDGSFNGKENEPGVYYYMLRAKCLTGYQENKHGELTLIR